MTSSSIHFISRIRRRPLAAGLVFAFSGLGVFCSNALASSVLAVTNCLDSGSGSLRATVAAAASGDTVDLSSLTCGAISLTTGEVLIGQHDLAIKGPGPAELSIDGNGANRIFRHANTGTLAISDLTITRGKYSRDSGAVSGGCLVSLGNMTLTNAVVSSCLATAKVTARAYGGGIFTSGNLTLDHTLVTTNFATAAASQNTFTSAVGGGAYVSGFLQASYSTIRDNSADTPQGNGRGGGLATVSGANVQHSTILANHASQAGAWQARSITTQSITIGESTISGNTATSIAAISTEVPTTISNSTVAFNKGVYSGAAVYAAADVSLRSTIVSDNVLSSANSPDQVADLGGFPLTRVITGFNNLVTTSQLAMPADTITACPKLGPLADNGGPTLTHAIAHDSTAIDHGNGELFPLNDQRGDGFGRMFGAGVDIGAYEWQGNKDDRIFSNGLETPCDI